jgi:hypothetical protein
MSEPLGDWWDPVFLELHHGVSAALGSRLTAMADEVVGRHIYYERMHALMAVEGTARSTDRSALAFDGEPSDAERALGFVFGQAFHQGCRLADVALAAGLSEDQVVTIGRRTIRRTGWLKRLV